jgi:hypothetical protein
MVLNTRYSVAEFGQTAIVPRYLFNLKCCQIATIVALLHCEILTIRYFPLSKVDNSDKMYRKSELWTEF